MVVPAFDDVALPATNGVTARRLRRCSTWPTGSRAACARSTPWRAWPTTSSCCWSVNVDRFKHINETLGHGFGDRALVKGQL